MEKYEESKEERHEGKRTSRSLALPDLRTARLEVGRDSLLRNKEKEEQFTAKRPGKVPHRRRPRSARLVELEIGDALEVTEVEGQEGEVVAEGGGGNQESEVGDPLATLPEQRPDLGEALHDRIVEAEQTVRAQEMAEAENVGRRVGVR